MIIEFTCKNFRSFKDETTLSMVAEKRVGEREGYNRTFQSANSPNLLSSAGLFGLNAGGKTNLFKALQVAVYFARNREYDDRPATQHPLLAPFLLDRRSKDKPTEIELVLWDKSNNAEYTYGFQITEKEVVEEWLYVSRKDQERFTRKAVFKRRGSKFTFGAGVDKAVRDFAGRVRRDASAVSVFSKVNHPESMRLLDLVKSSNLIILNVESSRDSLDYAVDKHAETTDLSEITNIVQRADLGIAGINLDKEELSLDKLKPKLRKRLVPFFSSISASPDKKGQGRFTIRTAMTIHHKYDEKRKRAGETEFSLMFDESSGTRMFIGLITAAVEALATGGVLVVDELGASMHPFLTKMIVDQFDNKQSNPNAAQLIYNSHETYLLGQETGLRRDQIWLADKNKFGESYLKRLSEYKTRKDFDIFRNYLAGRFGAVPFIDKQPHHFEN